MRFWYQFGFILAPKNHQNRTLEASWGVLGASEGVLEASLNVLGASWGVLGRPGAILEASWAILEASWAVLEASLACPKLRGAERTSAAPGRRIQNTSPGVPRQTTSKELS